MRFIRPVLFVVLLQLVATSSLLKAGRPSRFHDFAQVGDGGGIRSVILLSNQNGEEIANVTLTFRDAAGAPLQLTIDGQSNSTFNIVVPARGTRFLNTSGDGETVRTGWADLESDRPVGAQLLFEIRSNGVLATQAAVEDSGTLAAADVFVDNSGGQRVGLALANPTGQAPVSLLLTLVDPEGSQQQEQATITLAPHGQRAVFLDELFNQLGEFQGTLRIGASGSFALVALQQTGLVLGTLSPLEIF